MSEHLFSTLPSTAKVIKNFADGDYVFRQFDPVGAIYFLQSGQVQLQRMLENGFSIVVHQAQKQESFAEAALFSSIYHCDAVCMSKVSLIEISKRAVLEQMDGNPKFARGLMALLSKQVQHYRQRLQIAAINSAQERVLAALHAKLTFERITDLAASIGLTQEATYRALSGLVKQGYVTKHGRGQYALK